uniref:RNA uridylyltransferase n=1 Tax=Elaeophora elaphi TaxID=1147741 RepID=A0A158Q8M8_9BILA
MESTISDSSTADQKKKQKKRINNASTVAQSTRTENQKISRNTNKRRRTRQRRRTSHISATNNTLNMPGSSNLNWEVNGVSSAMNSEFRDFWGRPDMGFDRKKRNKKRSRLKDSSFHLVAFTASTSVTEGYANVVASNSDPDVISLSDEEGNENLEAGTEHALFEQGDHFNRHLQTLTSVRKEVPRCLTASEEMEKRRLDNATVIENEGTASFDSDSAEKIIPEMEDYCNEFDGIVEQLSELELIKAASNGLVTRKKEQLKMSVNVCGEKKHFTEVSPRRDPLSIRKDFFDELNVVPGTHKFVQNGKVELKIEKPEGKDFIQLILFECCGPLEDPKLVARGGYKICTSAVLHENTSIEVIREALIDLAEQLERISHDSLCPGEKLPYSVSKYSLPYLEKQFIYPLKKKTSRFPRAIYYCGLCQYHISSVFQAVAHFLAQKHIDNMEKEDSLKKLECLPEPAKEQTFKVDQIIRELYVFTRLTDVQYGVESQIANRLSHFLQSKTRKNFSVMVYGSHLMRLATLRSNLNLTLNFPQEYSLGHALSRVMEVLGDAAIGENFTVQSITSDFQRPDPSIRCIVNSVAVVITTNCVRQQRATQLINLYCTICSQFRILATVFRSWAELCSLTNLQLGGIPKFAFDIILIYYLQRKGLLPYVFEVTSFYIFCIHDQIESLQILTEEEILLLDSANLQFKHQVDKINTSFGAGNEEWNLGELWIGLFRYYAIEHSVEELIQIRWRKTHLSDDCTRWSRKRLAVEDPFAPDHIIQPQQRINSYFSSCFLCTYIHFAVPRTVVCSLIPYSVVMPETIDIQAKKKRKRRSRKTTMLNDSCSDEVAANTEQQNSRSDSDDADMKSLETSETQVSEAAASKQEIDALTKVGLETATQVSVLHSEDNLGHDGTTFLQKMDENDENLLVFGKCQDLKVLVSDCSTSRFDLSTSQNDGPRDDADEICCDSNVTSTLQQHNVYFSELPSEKDEFAETRLASASTLKIRFHDYDEVSVRKLWLSLNNTKYNYSWDLHCFTGGLEPVIRCTCCSADGHLRENCPELMIPIPKDFPPLTNAQRKMIDLIIFDVFNTMRIRPYYVNLMSALCHELEVFLRRFYRSDCHLSLFGSAGNGFGLLGSDADICLRFGPQVKIEDIDPTEVICKVAEVVRKMPDVVFVSEIPHAKVPIVKFHCRNRLEADVSLYNVLALENTRLLRTYSKLDGRIHQLGIMTKMWAKNCEIGNASKGSLSSYSYIIMLIHYLQRTNPPVAPFLQEVSPSGRRKEPVIIDDCDVYFCNLEDLEWTVYNRSTVGELWVGFLNYFGMKFDFAQEVVQIRQTQPLMKLDKGWQSRPIAIEDPFDLNHNLSSGVHSKTMVYIQKSFIQSWEKFSTMSIPNSKLNHSSLVLYATSLLSKCRVGNGPPLDRNCCHRCRQIGHFVMDCPRGMKDKKHNK